MVSLRCQRGFIGEIISGVLGLIGGERRNEQAEDAANSQMAFQERMSSTAHQREVADLKAAGLNPMLSSKYGGSSSPPGAMATVENSLLPASNSAMAVALNRANINKMNAEAEKARAEGNQATTQSQVNLSQVPFYQQQIAESEARVPLHGASASELANREMLQTSQAVRNASQTESDLVQRALWRAERGLVMSKQEREALEVFLRSMDWPKVHAESMAHGSWFGRNVMPYTKSIHDLASSGASASLLFGRFGPFGGLGLRPPPREVYHYRKGSK